MNEVSKIITRIGLDGVQLKILAGPVMILMILMMMVVPLPPLALDVLFTFNISLALTVLLVAVFTKKPLEFSAFPSILLMTTLMRLALNVASTRVVLMNGHEGSAAAGHVIESFGEFLVGGNFAVGIAIFVIFVVINFMVITKGAGRIAEVGARFTLDAMPGKQMAIDADLNSGMINEDEARKRRKEVSQESDFYGSMDGASKFVRGDAIAGIIIMGVNLFVGMFIGIMQHDMSAADASRTYTMLAIGDGLVAAVPALMISIAAGLIVSRVNTEEDIGEQMVGQIYANPIVMYIAASVIFLLGVSPGMPHLMFISFSIMLFWLGYSLHKKQQNAHISNDNLLPAAKAVKELPEASWDDVKMVDVLTLEVGHRLISMVDKNLDGSLVGRIKSVRKKFAEEMGFLPASVHIRDNLNLPSDSYTISLSGIVIGKGELNPDGLLAINSGNDAPDIEGIKTKDPAFGLPAVWIEKAGQTKALMLGYTCVDPSTVVATHLDHLLRKHASDLLGRNEVQHLIDKVASENKQLAEDVIPKLLNSTQLQRILQALLIESVSIRDLRTIFEVLAEYASLHQNDWQELVSILRISLGRAITFQHFKDAETLHVISLDSQLEALILQAASTGSFEPTVGMRIANDAKKCVEDQLEMGYPPVLLVNHPIRALLSEYLRKRVGRIVVMSLSEVAHERSIQVTSTIGGANR